MKSCVTGTRQWFVARIANFVGWFEFFEGGLEFLFSEIFYSTVLRFY